MDFSGGVLMAMYRVTFMPEKATISVEAETTLLQAQILAGLRPDAPCGGKGTCGKCRVWLEGREVLARFGNFVVCR